MNRNLLAVIGLFLLLVIVIGGTILVANAPQHPPVTTSHVAVPDDHIPR